MSAIDIAGYVAAALVFLTFAMKTLLPLRIAAIASNVAFVLYAYLAELAPILVLHGLLLPLNIWRTWEQLQLRRSIQHALEAAPSIDILLPFMTRQSANAGDVIFRKGDPANRLYYVKEGEVQVEEIERTLGAGSIFGEIGLFTQQQARTATVIAKEDSKLCWIGRQTVLELYQRNPSFGLVLTRLVAERMALNQSDLLARLAALENSNSAT
jgi:CRP/FNR family cyclic AMP-dependent transcriptional regulator